MFSTTMILAVGSLEALANSDVGQAFLTSIGIGKLKENANKPE